MNPINSQSMYSSLQRMADQAHNGMQRSAQPNLPGSGDGGGFSAVMKGMAEQVNSVQAEAGQKANDFSLGKPDADLAEAMIAMQRARVHFEAMVQVRNKLVSAYQEVMRMPV